ncbi:MAG TPA: hypothetical protein DC000_05530 [Clostridiales bacterium]|nr:hypothetical protein [Clostridiales bacterium]
MEIIIGLFVFFLFIGIALKAGVLLLKILFTVLGLIVGGAVIVMLLPLGLGLGLILLVPAILIGIIVSIFKCIMFIF